MSKKQIAFTLIELLVVIAIIGILSGLIIVTMNGVTTRANIAKSQIFNNSLRNALMMDMIAEWKFDELTTAVDGTSIQNSWGSGNNGTLDINTSATDTSDKLKSGTNCVSGKCLLFDGVDDYINCGSSSSLNLSNTATISFWAYFTSSSFSSREDFLSRDEREIIVSTGNTPANRQVFVWYANSSTPTWQPCSTTNNVLSENQWANIVTTIDVPNGIFKIYINGTEKGSCSVSGSIYNGANSYTIGGQGAARNFNGLIDDVRIFNAAKPTSQIKEQYYTGLNSLVASGSISNQEYLQRMASLAIVK